MLGYILAALLLTAPVVAVHAQPGCSLRWDPIRKEWVLICAGVVPISGETTCMKYYDPTTGKWYTICN
jgi:hypothetical protein